MKTFFRNLRTFALVALAACAVSCEDPNEGNEPNPGGDPTDQPDGKETVAYVFNEVDVFFAAGEMKTVTIRENQPVENLTITAPKGWVVAQDGAALDVTAPTQEAVDGGTAVANGKVSVKVETEEKIYEGSFGVYMGTTVVVEAVSNTFNDVQIKAIIKGVDKYSVHLGTNGEWMTAFDEWRYPSDMLPEPIPFGWDGQYYDVFEGSLFTFAKNPYDEDFVALPGVKYQLAILPVVEGKALADYDYADVYLFNLPTAEAGENGSVTPEFVFESKTHSDINVTINAANAYTTFYTFYSANDFAAIEGRDKVIKTDLITNGDRSTEGSFLASKSGLAQGSVVYLAAISLDQNGAYGELKIEEFCTEEFLFNDMVVTLGNITCSSDGTIVYIPVSTTGGEVDHYRYAYIPTSTSNWSINYGGSVEKAEIKIATVPSEYYGPEFAYPDELVDGKIVVGGAGSRQKPYPGTMARILVLAMDVDGVPSHAAYAEYTPTDASLSIITKDDENYEYGMPTVTYKNAFMKYFEDDGSYYPFVNFEVTLSEGTETAWICGAGEEYLGGWSSYELILEMTDEKMPFMKAQKFTADGIFECDALYITADGETRKAIWATWLDKNGKYHEVKLFFDPVDAAQEDLKNLSSQNAR